MATLTKKDLAHFQALRDRTIDVLTRLDDEFYKSQFVFDRDSVIKEAGIRTWHIVYKPYETGPDGVRRDEHTKWPADRFECESEIATLFRCLMPMYEFISATLLSGIVRRRKWYNPRDIVIEFKRVAS